MFEYVNWILFNKIIIFSSFYLNFNSFKFSCLAWNKIRGRKKNQRKRNKTIKKGDVSYSITMKQKKKK